MLRFDFVGSKDVSQIRSTTIIANFLLFTNTNMRLAPTVVALRIRIPAIVRDLVVGRILVEREVTSTTNKEAIIWQEVAEFSLPKFLSATAAENVIFFCC